MKTAIYIRVSTNMQSVEMQERSIRLYLESKGYGDLEIYSDSDISGCVTDRPSLNKLLNDCKQGKVQRLAVYKLDRLGRNIKHLMRTLEDLDSWGVSFISTQENIDMETSTGRLMLHILMAFAEFERDVISERTISGLANAKAKGKQLGRPSTIGLNDMERIKELSATGLSYRKIAQELNLGRNTVHRVLKGKVS